jgi:hypothetical protein
MTVIEAEHVNIVHSCGTVRLIGEEMMYCNYLCLANDGVSPSREITGHPTGARPRKVLVPRAHWRWSSSRWSSSYERKMSSYPG